MTEGLLTPADVAKRCRISTKTVLRAIQAGRLRASRLGRRGVYRIRPSDVDAWLDASAVEVDIEQPRAASVPKVSRRPAPAPTAGRLVVGDAMRPRR